MKETAKFADVRNIRMLDGGFKDSFKVGLNYLNGIDIDRLLAPSYEVHGLEAPNGAKRYGGWERLSASNWTDSPSTFTLAGHSLGHFMSAAAAFYGSGAEGMAEKMSYAVEGLSRLQETAASPYIGGCDEEVFLRAFEGKKDWHRGYWVPWYGIHKIYRGLIDICRMAESETAEKAFSVLVKFADWAADGLERMSDDEMQSMLDTEYGGMNEVFADLYEMTGRERYLTIAKRFTHDRVLRPLAEGRDELAGLHANTQIPKIIGAAAIYDECGEEYYRRAAENFWDFVINERSYAIGGNSISEHFEEKGLESLGAKTCESCNTYNMMCLCEKLFAWERKSEYMDWYELALYNHILGQQEPKSGAKMYFVSLLQGHHRIYEDKYNSWWCCTGTGMENPGRYTRCIYFEDGNELYVNLYIPNTFKWGGMELKTETAYPYSDTVSISVRGGGYARLKFRKPSWCGKMTVTAGGREYSQSDGGYISVDGAFEDGDVITVKIPMSLYAYRSRDNERIAVRYGCITLGEELGAAKNEYTADETRLDLTTEKTPYLLSGDIENIAEAEDESRLRFKIPGKLSSDGRDICLKPFFEIHHFHHNVYFNLNSAGDEFLRRLQNATADCVEPDGQQDELGHALCMNCEDRRGMFAAADGSGKMFREAYGETKNGESPYFSYKLGADADTKYICVLTEKRADSAPDFNIYADGVLLGRKSGYGYDFYEVNCGGESITVRLEAADKNARAEISEVRTVREKIE